MVVEGLDRQPADSVWLSSITVFETTDDLANRVLDFDSVAAATAAQLAADRQKVGRAVDLRDTLFAGIALARRATIQQAG